MGVALGAILYYDEQNQVVYAVQKDGTVKRYFLGVDGGGSKTNVTCIDEEKKVVGEGSSGCTNFNSVGQEKANQHLREAILSALKAAGVPEDQVAGICLSMSGVDRPADKQLMRSWITPILPNARIDVHNDAVAALVSGTDGNLFGLVVISGTGTITYGVNKEGETTRAAGWGPLLGDRGSGYQIGYEILNAVVRALDGRGPATSLVEAVLAKLNLSKGEELIPWAYSSVAWERYAQLAPLAAIAARNGDKVAEQILEAQAQDLVVSIQAVAKRLHLENQPFPLVLAGGNFTHEGSYLTDLLKKKVTQQVPHATVLLPTLKPEYAAALLARNNATAKP